MTSSNDPGAEAAAHPWHLTGLCLAVSLAAFAWSTRFIAEYTLPKLFVIQLGVFIAAAGAWRQAPASWRTPLALPIALNLFVLVLGASVSQDWRTSLLGRYNSYSHGLWAFGLYAAVCLGAAGLDRKSARRACGFVLAASAVVALYGLVQVFGYEPFLRAPLPAGNRAVSSIGSPVDLGAYLAALLPLAAAWGLGGSRWLGGAGFLAIAAGLVATGSRGSWLGAALGVGAYALLAGRVFGFERAREGVRRVPLWAWAALLLALAVTAWLGVKRVAARGQHGTDSSRVEVWRSALRIFRSHPILGTGPDTFEQAFRRMRSEEFVRRMKGSVRFQAYAHNDVLQALSTTGIIGTGAYLYLLLMIALTAWTACRGPDGWLASGVAGGLVAVFANVKFNPISIEVMTLVAFLCGLAAALARPERAEPAQETSRRLERAGTGLVAAFSAAGLVLVLRLLSADLESKYAQLEFARGQRASGMDHARAAIKLEPCVTAYRVQHMNEMGDLINSDKNVQGRLELLAEALASGKEAVRCHPEEVNPHYLYGMAAWMHVQLGLDQHLELAERELDAALERDPLFIPLLEQRLSVAAKRGGPTAQDWAARLAHARTLAPN